MATVLAIPTPEKISGAEVTWDEVKWLPCCLTAELQVQGFTLGDMLRLQVNSVINARRASSTDISLCANGQLIGWAEFDTSGEQLALRLTEIA